MYQSKDLSLNEKVVKLDNIQISAFKSITAWLLVTLFGLLYLDSRYVCMKVIYKLVSFTEIRCKIFRLISIEIIPLFGT